MLNAVIELALGLIVLYSVLSLVSSKVSELISSALSLRGRNLLKAVKHLVGDDCAKRIYEHPMIRSLYTDAPPATKKPNRLKELLRKYPSYLPADKFVIALLDGAAPSAVKAPPPLPPDPQALVPPSGTPAPSLPAGSTPAGPSPTDWSARITTELSAITDENLKKSLCSLWEAASHNVIAFRAGVENWFNNTMDRASGWYKRQTQRVLIVLGLVLAIALNVNTIGVTQRLWADGPFRSAVLEQVKKLPATATTTTVPGGTTTTTVVGATPPAPTLGQLGEQVKEIQGDLNEALKLPLGWGDGLTPDSFWGWVIAFFGWIITAIALSLGAPFWFDLLTKVAALRGSGTKEPTPTQTTAKK